MAFVSKTIVYCKILLHVLTAPKKTVKLMLKHYAAPSGDLYCASLQNQIEDPGFKSDFGGNTVLLKAVLYRLCYGFGYAGFRF